MRTERRFYTAHALMRLTQNEGLPSDGNAIGLEQVRIGAAARTCSYVPSGFVPIALSSHYSALAGRAHVSAR